MEKAAGKGSGLEFLSWRTRIGYVTLGKSLSPFLTLVSWLRRAGPYQSLGHHPAPAGQMLLPGSLSKAEVPVTMGLHFHRTTKIG